jgi:RNA recognition motif-containing protein
MIKTTEDELRKIFNPHGTIFDVCLRSKNGEIFFAFVEFDTIASAERAIEAYSHLNWMKLHISPFLHHYD